MPVGDLVRRLDSRPLVRPWALSAPILVLVVALPLLRPLRHPDMNGISDDEAARLATVSAVVENHTLALEQIDVGPGNPMPRQGLIEHGRHLYSEQPPAMALLLAGPYWVLTRFHLTLRSSPVLVPYLLTLIGVTLPVALAAGFLYKMGRIFELRRPWRAALAAAVVFGSGLISYSVVLNPHALAAALLLAGAAGLVYVSNSRRPGRSVGWLTASGACAGLAAAIDLPAAVFPLPMVLVILTMRWPRIRRGAGVALFLAGVLVPVYLTAAVNHLVTGDWKPAVLHQELAISGPYDRLNPQILEQAIPAAAVTPMLDGPDDDNAPSAWQADLTFIKRIGACLLGGHGLLSHFPVLLVAILGVGAVMHRNWPATTKMLASITGGGAAAVVISYALISADNRAAMFANQWFVVFLPLMLFWSGAWLRRQHHPLVWTAAGTLLAFSVVVSLIGATDPLPRDGYDHYSAADAAHRLITPQPAINPLASAAPIVSQ
jgi:hypothetical protein